jgi:hypothetical protein
MTWLPRVRQQRHHPALRREGVYQPIEHDGYEGAVEEGPVYWFGAEHSLDARPVHLEGEFEAR